MQPTMYEEEGSWALPFSRKENDAYCEALARRLQPKQSTYHAPSVIRCRGNPWTKPSTTLLAVVLLIAALLAL